MLLFKPVMWILKFPRSKINKPYKFFDILQVEEMGRRKDAERRKRREQRMAERLQQSKCSNEIYDGIKDEDQEMDKSPGDSQGACTQSIKTEGYKQSINEASDMSQCT